MKRSVEKRIMSRFSNYLGKKICNKTVLIYILNLTWGLLANIVGFLVFLILLPFSHGIETSNGCPYLRFRKEPINGGYGFSIGLFTCISGNTCKGFLNHEYGHTVQNAIFGPFMIFLILIPSMIRFHYREHLWKKGIESKTYYDDIWFEYSATRIGEFTSNILY